jgi:hypothetical protein
MRESHTDRTECNLSPSDANQPTPIGGGGGSTLGRLPFTPDVIAPASSLSAETAHGEPKQGV